MRDERLEIKVEEGMKKLGVRGSIGDKGEGIRRRMLEGWEGD